MAKPRNDPRLSVNKLAQYVTSRAARQNQILRNAKFPPDYITAYYRDAGEAIASFIGSGMNDLGVLDRTILKLLQSEASNIQQDRQKSANVDAIETFMGMLDDIDLKGANPSLGSHAAPHVTIAGVSVSVRPDIILRCEKKGSTLIGAIKLHFPRSEPLDIEQAGYVSAMLHRFASDHLLDEGTASTAHCMVVDVASAKFHPGVASVKKRMTDIQSSCGHIAQLWPSVTP